MLKLNNHGWGISAFIAFIAVFGIALILIIIGAINLGISSKNDVSTLPVTDTNLDSNTNSTNNAEDNYIVQIDNYKEQLVDVSKNYIETNTLKIADGDSLTITVVSLFKQNYINKLEIKGYTCTGYVTITNNSNNFGYTPYINCGNDHITELYNSDLDESF